MPMTTQELAASIQKGIFKPHIYLTNVCLSYFQNMSGFVARKVFPIVPVPTSSAHYYEFDKGDLARDNMARKPEFGHVSPGIYGKRDKFYHCEVDQVITGVDQISTLDFQRTNAPAIIVKERWPHSPAFSQKSSEKSSSSPKAALPMTSITRLS